MHSNGFYNRNSQKIRKNYVVSFKIIKDAHVKDRNVSAANRRKRVDAR